MPKKFQAENSKAAVARARKAAQLEEAKTKKQKEAEDEFWRDDNKQLQRKQQRKDERENKRLEALERKKEAQSLLEEETAAIKSAKPAPSSKVTQAEIAANRVRLEAEAAAAKPKPLMHDEVPLEENVNLALGAEGEARSVEDAISVLSVKEGAVDRHPEKRVKAAYQEFEDKNLPILKKQNTNLRLSQLKQMLKKEWMKSPENPLNQRQLAYNARK